MPKGRMLSRCISRSKKVAILSPKAALFFSWCIPHLDREGRIYANVKTLKGIVVPYLEYMTDEIIEECKTELYQAQLVLIYGQGEYMQFVGFSHHQIINPIRERPSEIPDPTPEDLAMFQKINKLRSNSGVTPDININININKYKSRPSAALDKALKDIYGNAGFNIYALIAKTKKALKQPVDFEFPEEVLLKVCQAYWREKEGIRNAWPWFCRVLYGEWVAYNIAKNIHENEAMKMDVPRALAALIKDFGKIPGKT